LQIQRGRSHRHLIAQPARLPNAAQPCAPRSFASNCRVDPAGDRPALASFTSQRTSCVAPSPFGADIRLGHQMTKTARNKTVSAQATSPWPAPSSQPQPVF